MFNFNYSIMKRFCVIVVSVIAVVFLCSATIKYVDEAKVTVTYGSMSYTTSLTAAEAVFNALPNDLELAARQALCDINIYDWADWEVYSGNYEGVYYEYNGPKETFICKYKNMSIKADHITSSRLVGIFHLERD